MNNTALLCPLYLCQAVRTETPSLGDPSCQWQSWRVKSWRTQGLLPPPSGWGTWRKRECELAAAAGFMTSCCLSIMVLWWRVLSPLPHKMTPRKVPPLPCPVQTTEQLPTSYLGSVFVWTSQAVPGPVSSNCISYCEGSRKIALNLRLLDPNFIIHLSFSIVFDVILCCPVEDPALVD